MKSKYQLFYSWWLLIGIIILFSSCQRIVHKPTKRIGVDGQSVPFKIKSALTEDQIASALLTSESLPCLKEISVLHGVADQFEVYSTSGAEFPTDNGIYLVMSSGDATAVVPGNASTYLSVSYASTEGVRPIVDGGSPSGSYSTNDRASLNLKLSVPSDATTLSFDWKFGSEEPSTFYESSYQDYFTVILNGTLPVVAETWVDHNVSVIGANLPSGFSSNPIPPFPNPNNTNYNSTTHEVQTTVINVTPYQGTTISLDFHVADASDRILDSGVFLDNLGFDTQCKEIRYEYVAKIICGLQKDPQDMRLARGFYATAINIHNPNNFEVPFFKKLALTYPPEEQEPGDIIPIANDTLQYDEALAVDCMDIKRELYPDGFETNYIKGFVVIQSRSSLDVTAVYTTASLDNNGNVTNHSSIDVEQIKERIITVVPEIPDDDKPTELLDHFKIYEIEPIDTNLIVFLSGQFDDESKEVLLDSLTHFANPVSKQYDNVLSKIKNPHHHLNWYALKQNEPEPRRTVFISNQFGHHSFDIQEPRYLLVPTEKTSDDGSIFPDSLDHYKCYQVINGEMMPNLPQILILNDQFDKQDSVRVIKPHFFCVPVTKKNPENDMVYEVKNDKDHLVIYDISIKYYDGLDIDTKDQFGDYSLHVKRSVMLAVPSEKKGVEIH